MAKGSPATRRGLLIPLYLFHQHLSQLQVWISHLIIPAAISARTYNTKGEIDASLNLPGLNFCKKMKLPTTQSQAAAKQY